MQPADRLPASDGENGSLQRLRIRVRGAVQGVGFRPFVYRLAHRHGLSGFVLNDPSGVLIEIEGNAATTFLADLRRKLPPLARIDGISTEQMPPEGCTGFMVRRSSSGAQVKTRIIPDAACCDACLKELFDSENRFYLYPFITCTHCGPRFTITKRLPYDRPQTSMARFPLCTACGRDYRDPSNRRFHAETIACPDCGPRLSHSIAAIAAELKRGGIVALKGIGGYHLLCDAADEIAVQTLRSRKARLDKPFAVMVGNAASAALFVSVDRIAYPFLCDKSRPVVLLRHLARLAPSLAPGLANLGIMLPSAPVHYLLFHALAGSPRGDRWLKAPLPVALIATSANLGGDPVIIDDDEARTRLAGIADLIVTHDRGIINRADDSVVSVIDRAPAFIRRGRGFVPDPIDLGADGPCVMGVGAHLKATVTVTRGCEAFVSQHIGDLDTASTVRFHAETARRLVSMLDVSPQAIACDLHPDYRSTCFAQDFAASLGIPLIAVQHHVAHVASVAAEHRVQGRLLGVALDGFGLGDDGAAWGGELILLDGARWQRLGHLAPLPLPGGDRAAREAWRMGVAALVALGKGEQAEKLFAAYPQAAVLASRLSVRDSPMTTSMGRLFDAASALLGVCLHQTYEGQAAMQLQALVRMPDVLAGGYHLTDAVLDFRPLLAALPGFRNTPGKGAELFHGTVIAGLTAWIRHHAMRHGVNHIALSGGAVLNTVLTDGLSDALRTSGLAPLLSRQVPANDGGLSLGQAHIARHSLVAPLYHRNEEEKSCVSPFLHA